MLVWNFIFGMPILELLEIFVGGTKSILFHSNPDQKRFQSKIIVPPIPPILPDPPNPWPNFSYDRRHRCYLRKENYESIESKSILVEGNSLIIDKFIDTSGTLEVEGD
ncbi:unnamed protein product [Rhizophagus irregularis]|uniref:Uncharacterized protein n=1 Tax=Rhizophagus irregularis TaxID=588596 RepID=A0A2I1ELJ2_9GLOM|nr:hypothetical protein RhiirB3_437076 [Rhizophagus irregularis]CAB4474945.1 unnamed protein product [Rhizophagus irregularis]CAB5386671.1 unnamed protein product [Rhizophagus irregularis]